MQIRRKSAAEIVAIAVLLTIAVAGLFVFKVWRDHDGHDYAWMRKEAILRPLPGATRVGGSESVGYTSSHVGVYYALPGEPKAVLGQYLQRYGAEYILRPTEALGLSGHAKNGLLVLIQVRLIRFAAPRSIPEPPGTRTIVSVSVSRPN